MANTANKTKTLSKKERLKSRVIIQTLFDRGGKSKVFFPIRAVWLITPLPIPTQSVQFAVSVPKRNFAKAVHRNQIKRKIREAYRLNKHILEAGIEKDGTVQIAVMFLYVGRKHEDCENLFKQTQNALTFIKKDIKRDVLRG